MDAEKNQSRILLLFTFEGMLITLVNNLVGNNNNFFATRLGANLKGLQTTFGIIFVLRIVSTGFWFFRWRRLRTWG